MKKDIVFRYLQGDRRYNHRLLLIGGIEYSTEKGNDFAPLAVCWSGRDNAHHSNPQPRPEQFQITDDLEKAIAEKGSQVIEITEEMLDSVFNARYRQKMTRDRPNVQVSRNSLIKLVGYTTTRANLSILLTELVANGGLPKTRRLQDGWKRTRIYQAIAAI